MENFINGFEDLSSVQKLGWVFLCLFVFWVLEGAIPLVRFNYKKLRHTGVNLFFLGSDLLINVLFTAATAGIYVWVMEYQVGVLNWVDLPFWLELLISVMMLDLVAQWFAHYLLHKVKWMWKFHLVHHSDTHVDATTGTRHHPGDYFIREVFSLLTVVVFGIPLAFYVFYRIMTVFFTYLTHANIVLPKWLDDTLGWVFITPNIHKFHHHFERPWTDSNYGNIFSIWDRLFGTLVNDDPHKIRYGVDVLNDELDENIGYQLKVPFDNTIKTDY